MTQAPTQDNTQAEASALMPALTPEQVLKPIAGTPHWQDHASLTTEGTSVGVYSRLGAGREFGDAYLCLVLREGNFSCSIDINSDEAREISMGLERGVHTVELIHSLGKVVEVPAIQSEDWVHYEQISPRFVDANFGGVSFRVFASQLEHQSKPEVQLHMHSKQGFIAGSQMLPGFLSPDAADELADSLKAAAYQARQLAAKQIAEGGAA